MAGVGRVMVSDRISTILSGIIQSPYRSTPPAARHKRIMFSDAEINRSDPKPQGLNWLSFVMNKNKLQIKKTGFAFRIRKRIVTGCELRVSGLAKDACD
jgi:hypothetical protein